MARGGIDLVSDEFEVRWDVDGDGQVGFSDIIAVLSAWGPCLDCAEDIDDSGVEQPVFVRIEDDTSPTPATPAKVVTRTFTAPVQDGEGNWGLGEAKVQAREKTIARNSQISFRKVVGYRFNAGAGSILPEWSPLITYRVDAQRKLQRSVDGGRTRTVAAYVDAFDVETRVDGTVVIPLITAKRRPAGGGWQRYANSTTIHPKN